MATTVRARPGVLGEISISNIQNIKPNIESLTRELDNFHIYDSEKENFCQPRVTVVQEDEALATIEDDDAFQAPSAAPDAGDFIFCDGENTISATSQDFKNNSTLARASQQLPGNKEQLSKHQEGQFEWLLSIPVGGPPKRRRHLGDSQDDTELCRSKKKLYFGCNLVHRRWQSGEGLGDGDKSANMYTLLATRIESEEDLAIYAPLETEEYYRCDMAEPQAGGSDMADGVAEHLVVPQPPRPLSRIEDSVEALDILEEEIEALAEVAHVERVSPRKTSPPAPSPNGARAKTTPLRRATSVRAGANSATGKSVQRSSSVRKPVTISEDTATTSARKAVPRPTSLLPPKPPARSSKAPTVAAFELPGEAVARRLKEQREARRSQQISSEQAEALAAVYSPSRPHFKSSKPLTRSTFELPGEAISRKKREEREAKLRAQEEEERKRREFKARPIRSSLTPGSVPRETLTSLARQNKQRQTDGSGDSTATTITPSAAASAAKTKRHSLAVFNSVSISSPAAAQRQHHTLPTRGRDNRGTSESAGTVGNRSGSGSSKRSPTVVSAEEVAQQRVRGREIFSRDNTSFTAERERERKEREQAAKAARQEAAERSRTLGREWKERQQVLGRMKA